MFKLKPSLGLALLAMMIVWPASSQAQKVAKESPLCDKQHYTMVGFSTPQYEIAICKPNGDSYL